MKYINLATTFTFLLMALAGNVCLAQGATANNDEIEVQVTGGTLQVTSDNRQLFEKTIGAKADTAVVEKGRNAKGDWLFSVLTQGNSPRRLVGHVKGDEVEIVWDEPITYTGDPGEETSVDVRLTDLDGDQRMEIVKGTLYGVARLCGQQELPLLFREKWDFKKKKFTPTIGQRLPAPDITLQVAEDFAPVHLEGLQFLSPDGVSSSMGDDRNPLLLTPPFALTDNRSETGWQPDSATGEGEFVSFSTFSSEWSMTAVGIQVAASANRTPRGERFNMPSSVILVFDQAVYRLQLPRTAGTHWFELPAPVKSNCISVVLEKGAAKSKAPMSLFEVQVQTEMHAANGLEKLAAQLDDEDRGEQAAQILGAVGASAYEAVKGQWKSLTPSGKRRAVRLLSEIAPVSGAHLLVSYAVSDGRFVHREMIAGLRKSNGKGEKVLAKYLFNKSDRKYKAAIQLLAEMGSQAAFERTLSAWSRVPKERRQTVLNTVAVLAKGKADRLDRVLEMASVLRVKKDWRSMFALLGICAVNPSSAEDASLLAREVYDDADFENRYRALRIIATAKVEMSVQFIVDVAGSENRFLRQLSAKALGQFGNDKLAQDALMQLATDSETAVGLEAMNALLKVPSTKKQTVILDAMNSPWPQMRTLAVKNALDLPGVKKQLVSSGLADENDMVVMAALSLSAKMKGRHLDRAIRDIFKKSTNAKLLVLAAEVTGTRCQSDAETLELLFKWLRVGAEPLANSSEKRVAVAAAKALGRIGSPEAIKHLKTARERSNLTTDEAIDNALAVAPQGCQAQ